MAEDNGIVRIDFVGTTTEIRAEIAVFRRELAELRKDVRTGIGLTTTDAEAKYTEAVRIGATTRTAARKTEASQQETFQAELSAQRTKELAAEDRAIAVSYKQREVQMRTMFQAQEAQRNKELLDTEAATKKEVALYEAASAKEVRAKEAQATKTAELLAKEVAATEAANAKIVASQEAANLKIARAQEAQTAKNAELLAKQTAAQEAAQAKMVAAAEAADAKIVRAQEAQIAKMTRAQEAYMADVEAGRIATGNAAFMGFRQRAGAEPIEQQARQGFFGRMFGGGGGYGGFNGELSREANGQLEGMSRYQQAFAMRGGLKSLGGFGGLTEAPLAGMASGAAGMTSGFAPFAMMGGHPAVAAGLIGAGGSMAWVYEVMKHGGEYQSALATMSAQTKVTGKDLDDFALSGRDLAKTFGSEAKDNVDGFARLIDAFGLELGKSKTELVGMMKSANEFAIAAKVPLPEAVNTLKGVFNNMGYSINGPGGPAQALKDFTAIAESFASATTRGQVRIDQLSDAFTKAGAVAARYGMTLTDVQAALEVGGRTNLSGAQVGTGLRNLVTYLGTADRNKQTRKDLAGIGLTPEQVNPATRLADGSILGLSNALVTLKTALDQSTDSTAKNHIMLDLGKLRWQGFLDVMLKNLPTLQQFEKEIGQTGDLARMAAVNLDTVEQKEAIVGKKLEDVLLGAFSGAAFNKTLDDIGHLADQLVQDEPDIAKATQAMITVIDAIAKWAPPVGSFGYHALGALAKAPVNAIGELTTGPYAPATLLHNLLHPAPGQLPALHTGFLHPGDKGAPSEYAAQTPSEAEAERARAAAYDAADLASIRATNARAKKATSGTTPKTGGTNDPKADRAAYRTAEDALAEHLSKELDDYITQGHSIEEIEAFQAKQQLAADEKKYAAGIKLHQRDGELHLRIEKEKIAIQKTADDKKDADETADIKESTDAINEYYDNQIELVKEKVENKTLTEKEGETQIFEFQQAQYQARIAILEKYYASDADIVQKANTKQEHGANAHAVRMTEIDQAMKDKRLEVQKSLDEELSQSKIALMPSDQQAGARENLRYENALKNINGLKLDDLDDANAKQKERNKLLAEELQIHQNILKTLEKEKGKEGDIFDALRIVVTGLSKSIINGFDIGGFTGNGQPDEPAGIVHRGEYVFDADTVARIGIPNLMALHRGEIPGFDDGGLVGPPNPAYIDPNENQDDPILMSDTPAMKAAKLQRQQANARSHATAVLGFLGSGVGPTQLAQAFTSPGRNTLGGFRPNPAATTFANAAQGLQFFQGAVQGGPLGMLKGMAGNFATAAKSEMADSTDPSLSGWDKFKRRFKNDPMTTLLSSIGGGFRSGGPVGGISSAGFHAAATYHKEFQSLISEMRGFHKTFQNTSFDKVLDQNKNIISQNQALQLEAQRGM